MNESKTLLTRISNYPHFDKTEIEPKTSIVVSSKGANMKEDARDAKRERKKEAN
jgi:hypothetical protein